MREAVVAVSAGLVFGGLLFIGCSYLVLILGPDLDASQLGF